MSILYNIASASADFTKLLRFSLELSLFLLLFYGYKYVYEPVIVQNEYFFSVDTLLIIGWILLYFIFGMEKDRIRFANLRNFSKLFAFLITYSLYFNLLQFIMSTKIDVSSNILFCISLSNVVFLVRVLMRQFIRNRFTKNLQNVFVYGAELATVDLINILTFSKKYRVVGVIDDVKHRRARSIAGLPVIPLAEVSDYASMKECRLVVFPNKLDSSPNAKAVEYLLANTDLSVCSAPTFDKSLENERRLTEVNPNIILNKMHSSFDSEVIHTGLSGKVVLVTGGGGSIGRELCSQIIHANPSVLIVVELSEYALYKLEQELKNEVIKIKSDIKLKLILGSIGDTNILENIFECFNIDIVYHAAAYKHVPLVEENIHASLENNVVNTSRLALHSARFQVNRFILISTDKAVRPTNVMGASKRLAEIVCQGIFKETDTIFSCVRFGNVIGSSGSVIPKFKEQINFGGPLTVTHPEVNRYFMSIPQAVSLVLHSSIMSKGNEVFLLDMGDPVKILDLAKNTIRLHGLKPVIRSAKDTPRAEDELNIEITGLRPGEKLYEELLIAGEKIPTSHAEIFISKENSFSKRSSATILEKIKRALRSSDDMAIKDLLQSLPIEYQPKPEVLRTNDINITNDMLESYSQDTGVATSIDNIETADKNLVRNFFRRVFIKSLHVYFLLTRALTIGVRVLIVNENSEVLLVKHSYMNGWHLPGGGVDQGETIFDAAVREVFEETSLVLEGELTTLGILHNESVSIRDHVVLLATKISRSSPKPSSVEISDVCFFSANNLPEDICPDTAYYIGQFMDENESTVIPLTKWSKLS